VASTIDVCGLFDAHGIVAARVTAHGSRHIAPRDYAGFQQQVDQIEPVARRLLESVPQLPLSNFSSLFYPLTKLRLMLGTTYGNVVISSGMVELSRSGDELAMILGHELALITKGLSHAE